MARNSGKDRGVDETQRPAVACTYRPVMVVKFACILIVLAFVFTFGTTLNVNIPLEGTLEELVVGDHDAQKLNKGPSTTSDKNVKVHKIETVHVSRETSQPSNEPVVSSMHNMTSATILNYTRVVEPPWYKQTAPLTIYSGGSWYFYNITTRPSVWCGLDKNSDVLRHACCSWDGGWDRSLFFPGVKCVGPGKDMKIGRIAMAGGNICRCATVSDIPDNVFGEYRYKYQGEFSNKTQMAFNGTKFCTNLGNRLLFILGDSTMEQVAGHLSNEISQTCGTCSHQIRMQLSDLGTPGLAPPLKPDRGVTVQVALEKAIAEVKEGNWEGGVLLMNYGAHLNKYRMYVVVVNYIVATLRKFQTALDESNIRVLWKTNGAPSPRCKSTPVPDPFPIPIQKTPHLFQEIYPNPTRKIFGFWKHVVYFDHKAYYMFKGVVHNFLDVTPGYMRKDLHADGVHLCVHPKTGSVLTFVNWLIYQALESPEVWHVR